MSDTRKLAVDANVLFTSVTFCYHVFQCFQHPATLQETMTTMALEIIEAINVGEMHFAIRTEGCMLANVPDANSFR